jgi:protein O-GlcNAc transferase
MAISKHNRTLLEQADLLKSQGEYLEAIKLCEEILADDLNCVEAYEEIGDNYISLRKLEKAEKALAQALKLDPTSANTHYLLGFLHSCKRDWQHSIKSLEKADELKSNHSEVLRCLGWSYFQNGNIDRGIVILERALALEPNDIYILTDLGVCYLTAKNIPKALPIFHRVLDLDPGNQKARECLMILEEYSLAARR